FKNFTWNCTAQNSNDVSLSSGFGVTETLSVVSTGSRSLNLPSGTTSIRNYSQSGGIVQAYSLLSNQTFQLNISGDFNMSGGTLRSTAVIFGTTSMNVNFNGTSAQLFNKTGGTISTSIFLGTATNTFTINNGSIVDFGTSVLNGTGNFTNNGTLITAHADGITTTGNSGTIQLNGTRTYSTSGNYHFDGSVAQVTGTGLPSIVNNLTIENTSGVSLTNSITINSTLNLVNGALNIAAKTLTFQNGNVPIQKTSGFLALSNNVNLVFGTSGNTGGASCNLPDNLFSSGSEVNQVTINRTNRIGLGNNLLIMNGSLILTNGVLDASGSSLVFQNHHTPVQRSNGSITTNSFTNISFGSNGNKGGNEFTLPDLLFTTTPVLNQLNINRNNSLKLGNQDLIINGTLSLISGNFDISNRTITFQNGNIPIERDGSNTIGKLITNTNTSIVFGTSGNKGGSTFTIPTDVFNSVPELFNFVINRTNPIILSSQDLTVLGTLTLTSGILSAGSNTVILGTDAIVSGGSANSHIQGNLRKWIKTGTSNISFQIGDGTVYAPVNLTLNGSISSSTGSITVKTVAGDQPNIGSSGINNNSSLNRYWTVTESTPVSGMSSFNASFNYSNSDNDPTSIPANYVIRRYQTTGWSSITVSGTPTSTSISGTNISGFGEFAVGNITGTIAVSTQPIDISVCAPGNASFTSASSSIPTPTVKWQRSAGGGVYEDITANMDEGTVYSGFTTGTLQITGTSTSMNGYVYRAVFTNINGTVNSNDASLTVNAVLTPTSSVVIQNGSNVICEGSPVTFRAIAANTGGGSVNYDFKVNGNSVQNGNNNLYNTSNLENGDIISCDIEVTNGVCLTKNEASSTTTNTNVSMEVTSPAVTLTSSVGTTICSGTRVVFTATATNYVTGSILYNFKINGNSVQNTNQNTFESSTLEQGDHVSCTITINGGTCSGKSVSSNEITMTVNPNVTPTLLLASSTGNTVCFGTNVLFTATPNNLGGGTIDSYD
ncbi:MAG: beta strand repeat-containing protein, partial [Lacibacter sp.]